MYRTALLAINCVLLIACAPTLHVPEINKHDIEKEVRYQEKLAAAKQTVTVDTED